MTEHVIRSVTYPTDETDEQQAEPALTLDQISGMLHAASLAKSRIDELEATAQADRERIAFHLEQATEVDRKTIAETIATVAEFWRKRVAAMEPGERQSVNLAWGRLSATKVGRKIERMDESALELWCYSHTEYLRTPDDPLPDWKAIKADIASGKLTDVPGVVVTEDDDYSVKVTID